MRRVCGLLVILLAWSALRTQAQAPSVVITPPSQQLPRDSIGHVRVRVINIQHLHAYNVQVVYDPLLVRFRFVRGLGFFGTLTFFTSMIDSVNGRVTVNEAVLGPEGQSGSGDLAELRFIGIANGTTTVSFVVADFRDTVNEVIPVTTQGALIQVGPQNSVGEFENGFSRGLRVDIYPNPFNPTAVIRYSAPVSGDVLFRICSLFGSEVYSEKRADGLPGSHTFFWNGQNNYGVDVSSGVYIGVVQIGEFNGTTKLVLLR